MNFLESLWSPGRHAGEHSIVHLVLALLVAFIVGQLNAWCYRWTHRGVSYTRTFTQALVLISVAGALSMSLVMSDPLAAFGLLGGMAIIRFRTVVRDAKDNVYVLLCLICGMAAGFGHIALALLGAAGANAIAMYLHWTGFGAWLATDSLLRFQVVGSRLNTSTIDPVIRWFCDRFSMLSVDESPSFDADGHKRFQCVYKVRLRDPASAPDFVSALEVEAQVGSVHLLVDRENEEVA